MAALIDPGPFRIPNHRKITVVAELCSHDQSSCPNCADLTAAAAEEQERYARDEAYRFDKFERGID